MDAPRRRPTRRLLVLTAAVLAVGCTPSSSSSAPSDPSRGAVAAAGTFEAELAFCVSETNRLRATIGRPPVERDAELDAYAGRAVRADAAAGTAHQYARDTAFGNGLVRAETEALRWSLSYFGSVKTIVERSLRQMWNEGPGGEHYRILSGPYVNVGCGLAVDGDNVSLAQAFR